jgi:hypothetical protein
MFGGSAMGLCRKSMQPGGFPVCLVHRVSSHGSAGNSLLLCTKGTNLIGIGNVSAGGV